MSSPVPDYDAEVIQKIVDRMARAEWITGTNIVTPDWYKLEFTAIGQARMNTLAKRLGADRESFGTVKQGLLAHLRVVFHMSIICRGLVPPLFTGEEVVFMCALACVHGKPMG